MKKAQWLSALLLVSVGSTAINANAQTKQAAHKKKAPHHRITERDITECTKLIDRVAARQNKMPVIPVMPVQNKALDMVSSNKVAAVHSKSPVAAQLFAADNAAPISHLPAKPIALPPQANKITTVKPTAPLATLATQPSFKATTATLVTASPVRHVVANQAKAPPVVSNLFANTKAVVPTKDLHPTIELSSSPKKLDLEHLQGKSASLAEIAKSGTADKPATTAAKNKKPASVNKKSATSTSEKKKH